MSQNERNLQMERFGECEPLCSVVMSSALVGCHAMAKCSMVDAMGDICYTKVTVMLAQ